MSKKLISLLLVSMSLFTLNFASADPNTGPREIDQSKILAETSDLSSQALASAVKGYREAFKKGEVDNPNILTVVDFSLPSSAKRLWVIDLKDDQILMNVRTTHGRNTGATYAKDFSNQPNSRKSSLGTYKTLNAYSGKYGLSLRLAGLDKGLNDNAYKRAIVVHPAQYASQSFFERNHRLGRSWGCFALNPTVSKKFVNLTKGGSIIYAYAPQLQAVV